jgi:fatty acid desaturase
MSQNQSKPLWPVLALLAVFMGALQLNAFFGANSAGAWLGLIVLWAALAWFVWFAFIGPAFRRLFGSRQPN